jgi:hypothetical protein
LFGFWLLVVFSLTRLLVVSAGEFIVQPPFDGSFTTRDGKEAYIIHYTYGNDYDPSGKMSYGQGVSPFFHWDKRDFTFEYPPGNFPLPPPEVCLICPPERCSHKGWLVHPSAWISVSYGFLTRLTWAYRVVPLR